MRHGSRPVPDPLPPSLAVLAHGIRRALPGFQPRGGVDAYVWRHRGRTRLIWALLDYLIDHPREPRNRALWFSLTVAERHPTIRH